MNWWLVALLNAITKLFVAGASYEAPLFDEVNQLIESKLTPMQEEIVCLKTKHKEEMVLLKTRYEKDMELIQREMEAMKTKYEELLVAFDQQRSELQHLLTEIHTNSPVGFSVYAEEDQECDDGDKIIFTGVESNFGQVFNTTNSSFSVQYHGVYLFAHQAHSATGRSIRTEILHNGQRVASTSAQGDDIGGGDSTAMVIIECYPADIVFVQCRQDADKLYAGYQLTNFSGYLLRIL